MCVLEVDHVTSEGFSHSSSTFNRLSCFYFGQGAGAGAAGHAVGAGRAGGLAGLRRHHGLQPLAPPPAQQPGDPPVRGDGGG